MAASMTRLCSNFSRLLVQNSSRSSINRCIHTQVLTPLCFRVSPYLSAEPMKKKKKIDPNVTKEKEQRKKRKIEKTLRRLEKGGRKLKPVDEINGDYLLQKEKQLRSREPVQLSESDIEYRALLKKEWSNYKQKQTCAESVALRRLEYSRERALAELRNVSEDLYHEAVRLDSDLVPLTCTGIVETPPISDYDSPDGEYIDTTKKY